MQPMTKMHAANDLVLAPRTKGAKARERWIERTQSGTKVRNEMRLVLNVALNMRSPCFQPKKQERVRHDSKRKATSLPKLPTPVLSGSGSRVFLSPTPWSTPVSIMRLKHSAEEFATHGHIGSLRIDQGLQRANSISRPPVSSTSSNPARIFRKKEAHSTFNRPYICKENN